MVFLKKIYHYLIPFIAHWYYGRPSKKLIVIGVTGTKGKSTTCHFIHSIFQASGYKSCLMTTVEYRIGDKIFENKNKMTMLGRGKIHKFLRKAVQSSCRYAVIETSSEGILQFRHLCLNYDVAVFTNLGTEHSERHGGSENLKKDKGKLFANLKNNKKIFGKKIKKIIIVNGDDKYANYYLNFKADEKIVYGIDKKNGIDIIGTDIKHQNEGMKFLVNNFKFVINLLGRFNVYNALAAIAVGQSQKIKKQQIKQGLINVKKVLGRMEFIEEGQDFDVIVDYAHEPLSYTALFNELREMLNNDDRKKNKIISVIGSDGGGRDKLKRRKMGQIAGELTDVVVITDVNCFDENPKEIVEMLAIGSRETGKQDNKNLFIEINRKKAIELACKQAQTGDIVVITAKGNEPYMVGANGKKISWDDCEITRKILNCF